MHVPYGRLLLVAAAGASALAATQHAHAAVVIEQYDDARPAEAEPIMEVLREQLTTAGEWAEPDLVATAFRFAPMPAIADPGLTSAALIDELELSVKKYLHVDYEAAVRQLRIALGHAHANPGLVVNDDKARSAVLRAQVALALTHAKLGDRPGAIEDMTAYLRSTPEPVMRKMFGPPGEQLYNEVRKALDPVKRGALIVNVSEPDAQIFVNGLGTGRGASFTALLLPGTYRVVVQVGHAARRYDVVVRPDEASTLEIDWALDAALDLSHAWAGLRGSGGHPAPEVVREISRSMGNQIDLIVVGVRREHGYLAVVGRYYDSALTGHLGRGGEVHVASGRTALDRARLGELARFLSKGEPSADVVPIGTPDGQPPDGARPRRWIAYAVGAAALGGIALGGYLLYLDGKPACDSGPASGCMSLYATRTGGLAALTGSVLAGAFAMTWYKSHGRTEQQALISYRPVPAGGIVTLGGRF